MKGIILFISLFFTVISTKIYGQIEMDSVAVAKDSIKVEKEDHQLQLFIYSGLQNYSISSAQSKTNDNKYTIGVDKSNGYGFLLGTSIKYGAVRFGIEFTQYEYDYYVKGSQGALSTNNNKLYNISFPLKVDIPLGFVKNLNLVAGAGGRISIIDHKTLYDVLPKDDVAILNEDIGNSFSNFSPFMLLGTSYALGNFELEFDFIYSRVVAYKIDYLGKNYFDNSTIYQFNLSMAYTFNFK
ncbi:hypothetical protein [Aureibacter tunicatorum]|uniref:Outer membrane protein beta-barrel domain-containing protein n=1 Tax=Aureibacter tunicatorum TaxID=866807 RepID=A0AAE3XS68_9BACT|nr:hypothetical protein [Aureibacter tunicatorum]MDR6241565.1 hypothetical protein [Aureibacter tunicatorum]